MKQQKRKKKNKAGVQERINENVSAQAEEKMVSKVKEIASPLCDSAGFELVCVEYQREAVGTVLRIYIDKPGGVSLSDCSSVSRQLSDILDVYLEDGPPYNLEVSSPGTARPLGKEADFIRFIGEVAEVRTRQPVDGKKKIRGILMGFSAGMVKLMVNDDVITIPYRDIKKAGLVNYNGEVR